MARVMVAVLRRTEPSYSHLPRQQEFLSEFRTLASGQNARIAGLIPAIRSPLLLAVGQAELYRGILADIDIVLRFA